MPKHEPPTVPPKHLKELAFKRHGDAIQQVLTEAKALGEQPAVRERLRQVRQHIEAQRIIARDLLDKKQH